MLPPIAMLQKKIREQFFGQCSNQNRIHLTFLQRIANTSRNKRVYSAEKVAAVKNKIHKVIFSAMLWYIVTTHTCIFADPCCWEVRRHFVQLLSRFTLPWNYIANGISFRAQHSRTELYASPTV